MNKRYQKHKAHFLRATIAACLSFWAAIFAILSLYWSATAVITFAVICSWLGVVAYIEARDAEIELERCEAEEKEPSTQTTP
jgi:fatty acid desaturase